MVGYQHWHLSGNSCSQTGPKCNALYSFGSCRCRREVRLYSLSRAGCLYTIAQAWALESSLQIHQQRDWIWTKQGATFTSQDKRIPTTPTEYISTWGIPKVLIPNMTAEKWIHLFYFYNYFFYVLHPFRTWVIIVLHNFLSFVIHSNIFYPPHLLFSHPLSQSC